MRIYLDSAPVIYLIQEVPPYCHFLDSLLSAEPEKKVVSDITRLECRVKPLRDGRLGLLDEFDRFFEDNEVIPLSSEIVDRATRVQAQHRFSTPDSLHLAASLVSECDVFLTNDRQLSSFPEITVELID